MSLPAYSRPASTVQEEFAAIPSGQVAPQPSCIIGPLYRVFDATSSTDRPLLGLGAYTYGEDTTFSYPSLPAGAVVDLSSAKIRMENVLARYASLSGAGVIQAGSQQNQITIPTGNGFRAYTNAAGTSYSRKSVFKARDVSVGDRVTVNNGSISLQTRITGFLNEIIAATTGSPTATSNPSTQAYSGSVVNTNVQGTDHTAAVNTSNSTYVGDITVPVISDNYTLQCTNAGTAGVKQINTATVVGTIGASGAGNATVVITAAGLTGSPLTIPVAVANNDTASAVAGKIVTALLATPVVAAFFAISASGAAITFTKKVPSANDSTLNIAISNGTCTGLTAAPTSTLSQSGAVGTAIFKVLSDSGDNIASLPLTNIAFGTVFNIGTRGLQGSLSGTQAFVVGEQYTFTVAAAYTRSAPVLTSSSSSYSGSLDTVYKIAVVKGGLWSNQPQVVVTTNNAVDAAPPQIVAYNTSFAVGNLGVVAKFNTDLSSAQNGLVAGDVYYISATAAQQGAVRTAILANRLDSSITAGTDLTVDFFIFKQSIDLAPRGYPDFSSTTIIPSANSFVVPADIVVQDPTWFENDGVTLADLAVIQASMLISYRALLVTTSGVLSSISDIPSVTAVLGDTSAQNPLGAGVFAALENAAGQSVYFLPIKSDDIDGYLAALAALERDNRPYFFVPCTSDEATREAITGFINAQSAPINARECMGVYGIDVDPVALKYNTKGSGGNWTGYVEATPGSSPPVYATAIVPGATFLLDGIRPGDEFRSDFGVDAFGNPTYSAATVSEVADEETLILVSPGMSGAIGSSGNLQRIQVARLLTLDEQATALMQQSAAVANRRISTVFQDIGSSAPPFVHAAAIAGLASSVAPHQPITSYTVNGFGDATGSVRGFTPDQLDVIASGGTLIITKSVSEGQVFIRHQLTTDRSDDLHAEMSVTRNYDAIADFLREGFAPFQGKYNIGPGYFQLLDVTMRRRLGLLNDTIVTPSAGTQIISWDEKSLSITQDPVARTKVNMVVNFVMPMPNNETSLTLIASA